MPYNKMLAGAKMLSRKFACRASANPLARCRGPTPRGKVCRRPDQLAFSPSPKLPRTSPFVVCQAAKPASKAEQEANDKRRSESGNLGSSTDWSWTLNWNSVRDNIIVGSCPRSPDDVDEIVEGAGATALLSLQCDDCLQALGINAEAIRACGVRRGVAMVRVPIRDFDHADQTLMLPEAVWTLAMLLATGHKVYVHCTAGINRATLTVLGYLTFVQGWELHSALDFIKSKRPQAHPYVDCWKSTKARMLQGRKDEVVALAKSLSRESTSKEGDSFANWVEAENRLVRETFQRQLACSLAVASQMAVSKTATTVSSACTMPEELEKTREEITSLKQDSEQEQEVGSKSETCRAALADLAEAQNEISALRQGLMEIGETTKRTLHDMPPNSSTNHQSRAENPMSDIGPTTSL